MNAVASFIEPLRGETETVKQSNIAFRTIQKWRKNNAAEAGVDRTDANGGHDPSSCMKLLGAGIPVQFSFEGANRG